MGPIQPLKFLQSGKNLDFGLIWRQKDPCLQIRSFREKSGRATELAFWSPNFMQKKQKNPWSRFP